MKPILLIGALIVAIAASAIPSHAATAKTEETAFNANEFSLSLYGNAEINTAARVKEAVSVGAGVGADYFFTKGFGFGVRAQLSDYSHSVIDQSSARLIARAPLWDSIAPYGYCEGGFNFETDRVFAGAGGGIELRLKKWINSDVATFAELGLRTDTRGYATGEAFAGLKIPLSFKK